MHPTKLKFQSTPVNVLDCWVLDAFKGPWMQSEDKSRCISHAAVKSKQKCRIILHFLSFSSPQCMLGVRHLFWASRNKHPLLFIYTEEIFFSRIIRVPYHVKWKASVQNMYCVAYSFTSAFSSKTLYKTTYDKLPGKRNSGSVGGNRDPYSPQVLS